MKVFEVLLKNISGTLSISEAVAILADQEKIPTVSHAHMHLRDGFAVGKIPAFVLNNDLSRNHYEEAHMTTAARVQPVVVPMWDGVGNPPSNCFHLDVRRSALPAPNSTRSKYDLRSAQAEVPGITPITRLDPVMTRSDAITKKNVTGLAPDLPSFMVVDEDVGDIPSRVKTLNGRFSVAAPTQPNGDWKRVSKGGEAKVSYVANVIRQKVTRIAGSEKHTMFEDSESMAMHLCAALRSSAGRSALALLRSKPLGDPGTVGVFSKTAVDQVDRFINDPKKKLKVPHPKPLVIERVTDMRAGAVRTAGNPNPVADTFQYQKKDIDHIVMVLGKRADGSLNVVTIFPSPDTTQATMQVDNSGQVDLVEPVFMKGTTAIRMDQVSMNLSW